MRKQAYLFLRDQESEIITNNKATTVTVYVEIFVDHARELGKLLAEGTTPAVCISEDGFKEPGKSS